MLDLENPDADPLISLGDAAKRLPGRPSIVTLWRWHRRGVRGVKLQTVLIGGRRFVAVSALEQFIAATTAVASGEKPAARTPRQRQRAIEKAERELAAAGI